MSGFHHFHDHKARRLTRRTAIPLLRLVFCFCGSLSWPRLTPSPNVYAPDTWPTNGKRLSISREEPAIPDAQASWLSTSTLDSHVRESRIRFTALTKTIISAGALVHLTPALWKAQATNSPSDMRALGGILFPPNVRASVMIGSHSFLSMRFTCPARDDYS